jgi:hypothetical protein
MSWPRRALRFCIAHKAPPKRFARGVANCIATLFVIFPALTHDFLQPFWLGGKRFYGAINTKAYDCFI